MKFFTTQQIREADAYTIVHEPISSLDLMERAASRLYKWITKHVDSTHTFYIYAGPGNNGGDGLALARMLLEKGYTVNTCLVRYTNKSSDDFDSNLVRLKKTKEANIIELAEGDSFPRLAEEDVVVDGLFGSGLSRPVTGFAADVINHINSLDSVIISIDIPSGLYADKNTDTKKGAVVKADYTLSFQFPKLAFFLPQNEAFCGKWKVLDIGLSHEYINSTGTSYFYMKKRDIRPMLKNRPAFSHKGTYGHALLIAGGYGKMGAAILASKGCLRTGVGLLHTHVPKAAIQILQTATPETMISIDRYENFFSEVPDLAPYNAIGVGPGIGKEKQSQMALKVLIQQSGVPIVFDADALNILAENKTWLSFLPKGSILTPHPKEFERLAGKWSNDFEKLDLLKSFSFKFGVYLVLKGAYTVTCFPDGNLYFNTTGNPGMATAGSGDVLTGMITSLLAQGYSPGQAAVIGVYLHGLAGDIAAKRIGKEAMLAGDIIENIGKAFTKLQAR